MPDHRILECKTTKPLPPKCYRVGVNELSDYVFIRNGLQPDRTKKSRKDPAKRVESRPRPPDWTLMTDWPIMAQPAMPPKKPATMLAIPCPVHSWFLALGVSVKSSTITAVMRDSNNPTTARVAE